MGPRVGRIGFFVVSLIFLLKATPFIKYVTIATFPERFYTQVPEVVVVSYVFYALVEFVFEKCIMIAPLALYFDEQNFYRQQIEVE